MCMALRDAAYVSVLHIQAALCGAVNEVEVWGQAVLYAVPAAPLLGLGGHQINHNLVVGSAVQAEDALKRGRTEGSTVRVQGSIRNKSIFSYKVASSRCG